MLILSSMMGVTVVITITAVIFSCIYRRDEDDPDDPYTSLQQPASDLYQTISHCRQGKIATEPGDIEPYSTFMQRESGLYSTVRLNVC
ncbi:hypothetical protein FQN60_006876 [Etheostoma spectabile]|uniref:Uncharacterized protein n=1 Tax=Etheostoma spectabile TaxID=54343 RepID=A0A5J5CFK0_9PERO|nr:hypothetical protein FQN60_006876 [Etheostoma spectabile]